MTARRQNTIAIFYALALGVFVLIQYIRISLPACTTYCVGLHNAILDNTLTSPFVYRVLSPFAVNVLVGGARDFQTVSMGYIIAHAIVFPVLFVLLYLWLRRWLSLPASVAGISIAAALFNVMLPLWAVALYNAVEAALLCAALLLITDQRRLRFGLLCAITALAALNRETSVLIPLAFAAYTLPVNRDRRSLLRSAVLLGIWGAIFVGIRIIRGSAPDDTPIAVAWNMNTNGGWWTISAIENNLPFMFVWIAALAFYGRAAPGLKRIALVAPVYAGLFLVFALWNEVRLLLPLLILLLPISLFPIDQNR